MVVFISAQLRKQVCVLRFILGRFSAYLCIAAACAASLARCDGSRPDPPLCISPIPFARELFLERKEPKKPEARLEARLSLLSVRWNLRRIPFPLFGVGVIVDISLFVFTCSDSGGIAAWPARSK